MIQFLWFLKKLANNEQAISILNFVSMRLHARSFTRWARHTKQAELAFHSAVVLSTATKIVL